MFSPLLCNNNRKDWIMQVTRVSCWHSPRDDDCVAEETDYLFFVLSRHFVILEDDKHPGVMDMMSQSYNHTVSKYLHFQDCRLLPGLRVLRGLRLPRQLQPQLRHWLRLRPVLQREARQDILQGPGQSRQRAEGY